MSKEQKNLMYYYLYQGWYGQLSNLCDSIISKKGKDPITLYWKAYSLAAQGNVSDALKQLESFKARKDLYYPVVLAQMNYHQRAKKVDQETISMLSAELSAAEDIVKEPGLVLAARFALYTRDFNVAKEICRKILSSYNNTFPTSVFEQEAITVDYWCTLFDFESRSNENSAASKSLKRKLSELDNILRGKLDQVDSDLLILSIKVKQLLNEYDSAMDILNESIAMYPAYPHFLSEKAIMLASLGEWEQALDTTQRVLDIESNHLDALKIITIHAFTQDYHIDDAIQKLEDFDKALSDEPYSVNSTLRSVQLLTKICHRQPRALEICVNMIERVAKFCANTDEKVELQCSLGQVRLLQGPNHYANAGNAFRDALRQESNNPNVILGMIKYHIFDGQYEDAVAQIELLLVMHSIDNIDIEFHYLKALLAKDYQHNLKAHLESINVCKSHIDRIRDNAPGSCYSPFAILSDCNPDFMLLLSVEYLHHLQSNSSLVPLYDQESEQSQGENTSTVNVNDDASKVSSNGITLLLDALKLCPGNLTIRVELARYYALTCMPDEELRILSEALALNPNSSLLLLAWAKFEISRFQPVAANRALEQALASDFSIRSLTLFRLLQVFVKVQLKKFDEVSTELNAIVKLPEISNSISRSGAFSLSPFRLLDSDRVNAFIVYSYVLGKTKRLKEAKQVLNEAKVIFAGTDQEVQILIASSQLAVERKDYDSAIRMLEKIPSDNITAFLYAVSYKANILLEHLHDKEGFIQCYKELADKSNTEGRSYFALGEAYLKILNPELAVEAFERAFHLGYREKKIKLRIGKTLIATHEYNRAIQFYEECIRDLNNLLHSSTSDEQEASIQFEVVILSHELAKLFNMLGKHDKSHKILQKILYRTDYVTTSDLGTSANSTYGKRNMNQKVKPESLQNIQQDVITLLLLTDIMKNNLKKEDTLLEYSSCLLEAKAAQMEIINTIRSRLSSSSSSDTLEIERKRYSDICLKLGTLKLSFLKQTAEAFKFFEEAVEYSSANIHAILGLAKIHKMNGSLESCKLECRKALNINSTNDEAAILLSEVIMSEISFKASNSKIPMDSKDDDSTNRNQSDIILEALDPLNEFLHDQPNNFYALEKIIRLLHRGGKLHESTIYFQNAEKFDRMASKSAGYHFCQGLVARYSNDAGKAIVEFNFTRRHEYWGKEALFHMIELYLNPDQEGLWDTKSSDTNKNTTMNEQTHAYLQAAETLLKELKSKIIKEDSRRFSILENYYYFATRQKSNIHLAMKNFIAMYDENNDDLAAILGMAAGYMIEGNEHKAQNLLKRVAKIEFSESCCIEFVKANLLLAKIFVDKDKESQAQELCHRCLAYNKSCSEAWEILGLIYEKRNDYDHAAECYEKAWKLGFELSATIGYKLSFTYLKCRRLTDCIDVCEIVLQQYPDYPLIRDQILKKAMENMRMNK